MKILQVVPTLSSGGAETFVVDLAVSLSDLGNDVEVFLIGGARGSRGSALLKMLSAAGIRCHGVENRSARDLSNILKFARVLSKGKYDVVHAHLYSVEVLLAALSPFIFGRHRPLLVRTLHNSNIYGSRSKLLTTALSRAFDWNFACGYRVFRSYAELFGAKRLSAIENGVAFGHLGDAAERPAGLDSLRDRTDNFVVACVGAFRGSSLATSQKAQDIAIRAFCEAFPNDPSAHLLLVGDGELRAEAEQLYAETNATNHVHFTGVLPSCGPVYQLVDLLLLPSRFEGLPIAGLEAGCMGVPVLASRIPELLEVGGSRGWQFCDVDSVSDFASSLIRIRAQAANVKRTAQQYSEMFRADYGMRRCAKEYLSEINRIMAS